jgi:hypothetical protein
VTSDLDVFEHGQVLKQLRQLEGPYQPAFCNSFGRNAGYILILEENTASGRMKKSRDHAEQRRFAGAIWADDGRNALRWHFEADGIVCNEPSKSAGQ